MRKRMLSALLAVVILFALIPVRNVNALSVSELESQISNTYHMACVKAGRYSFNGYCASLVNWQLVILGINSYYVSGNGKDEFDNYKNRTQSNGGYYITAYPAADYDLGNALNAITNNGSTDAYNIMVGFEKSSTSLGRRYGHVVLIHGIVDGVAYFCESFDNTIEDTTYPEGTVISCSLDTFVQYYDSWATLDGVIHFEEEVCTHTYENAGVCTLCGKAYPWILNKSGMGIYKAVQDFAPYTGGPYSQSAVDSGYTVTADTEVDVAGSIVNAYGEIWYQLSYGGRTGYIPAEYLVFASASYGEQETSCTLTSPEEGAIVPRAAYPVIGTVTSKYPLRKVQAYLDDELYATVSLGNQTSLNIRNSVINHNLSFSSLAPGPHTLTIRACDIYRDEMTVICQRSFITEGEIICEHSYTGVVTEPTCTAAGFTTYTCSICGDSYTGDETAAQGHTCAYTAAAAPTADAEGILSGTCETCGETVTQVLPILNEADYTLTVISEPTVETEGQGVYTWNVTDYGEFSFEVTLDKLPDPSKIIYGDADGNGKIQTNDAKLILQHIVRMPVELNLDACDVDGNGKIQTNDAKLILQYIVKIISQFPIEANA